ncbi:hypothetical protein D3C76_1513540 [compost metagenome]
MLGHRRPHIEAQGSADFLRRRLQGFLQLRFEALQHLIEPLAFDGQADAPGQAFEQA